MRTFDYKKRYERLLQPDIVALVAQIHEYKGEQTLFVEAKADTLTQLLEVAKIRVRRHPIKSKVSILRMIV